MSSFRDVADAIGFSIQKKSGFCVLPSAAGKRFMTTKQQQMWQELCLKAVLEPDPAKQMEIVAELNRMLQRRQKGGPAAQNHALKQHPAR
jgi:hypothetical protein